MTDRVTWQDIEQTLNRLAAYQLQAKKWEYVAMGAAATMAIATALWAGFDLEEQVIHQCSGVFQKPSIIYRDP